MTVLEILRQAAGCGVELQAHEDSIVASPPRALPADLRARIAAEKPTLIAALASPAHTLRGIWEAEVCEVRDDWLAHKTLHGAAPWLPPEIEEPLQAEVATALRGAHLACGLRAIERWRRAWLDLLSTPPRESVHPSTDALEMADRLFAEADGTRPPPNPTVHQMFHQFRDGLPRARGPP